jgi:hypothetical protein
MQTFDGEKAHLASDLQVGGFKIGDIPDKARDVMRVIFEIIELTPIGAKIQASQQIVKFIANIADGKKMSITEIMDVACAVNEIIPSSGELVSFFTKSKKVR